MASKTADKKLNDRLIRDALIEFFIQKYTARTQIIEELHVANGRAKADVVTIFDEPHCYEIKSDLDRIERISEQQPFYEKVFRYNSVVTTRKHFEKAKQILPEEWGIFLASISEENKVVVRKIRRAKLNHNFDKATALLTLWKSEMMELEPQDWQHLKKMSREKIASEYATKLRKKTISKLIAELLLKRDVTKLQYYS